MVDVEEWGWKRRPATDGEFEEMMVSLDAYLAGKGVLPHQRPIAGRRLVGRLLGISVVIGRSAFLFGAIDDDPTMERVSPWFQKMYCNRLNPPFRSRSFVVNLRGTLWRFRAAIVYGTVALYPDRDLTNDRSVLSSLDDFTQDYANSLTDSELSLVMEAGAIGYQAIEALGSFEDHVLFEIAWLDYEHSVDALMSGIDWGKARWETAQTAEKVMKGMLLKLDPTLNVRKFNHRVVDVGQAVEAAFQIKIPLELLAAIDCKAEVRYGDEEATREEALAAHAALLRLLPILFQAFYRGKPAPPA